VSADRKGVTAASAAGGLIDVSDADLDADDLPEATLTRGLHEVTSLLITEFTLDDVLRVILETIYRALGVGRTRTLFLLKEASAPVLHLRFGLGQSASEMRAWKHVPLNQGDDIFSLVMRAQKDLVVRDSSAAEIATLLPRWYQDLITAPRYIVLLPLVIDQKPLGLFYIDGDEASAGVLTSPVLNYLKVLRGQAVVAIHQKNLRSGRRG
jgi:GAF domain-containing protein